MKIKKMPTKSVVMILIATTLVIFILFSALTVYEFAKITQIDVSRYSIMDMADMEYYLAPISTSDKTIRFEGWILLPGEDIATAQCYVVLQDMENNTYYQLKTQNIVRKDVTITFSDGHNYNNSGFGARNLNLFLKKGTEYRVCILYLNNDHEWLVPLNNYFSL